MNRVLEYVIGAKDRTHGAISSALGRIRSFASSVGRNLMNVKAGFEMAAGVVRRFAGIVSSAVGEAFRFEKAQSEFTGLLNSVEKAKEHISDLRRFASSTPLTFGDLSRASKLLLSFGMSVDDVMPSMKMLGDIAMGDSQKFQGLSLVFAQVKSAGKLMGQDLLQMINQGFNPLTVISQQTGKSMSELKDIMSEGGISFEMVAEAMRVATSDGGLFNNAMENASKTGEGLVSTLQDKWTDVVRTFGEAFSDSAKGGIQTLIDKLTELVEDGTVDVWANRIARELSKVSEVATSVASAIGWIVEKCNAIRDWVERTGAKTGAFVGTLSSGGSFSDARAAGSSAAAEVARKQAERRADNAASDEKARARASASRLAKETATAERAVSVERKSLSQMLVDAEAKERLRAERTLARERDALMRKTVEAYRKGLSEAQREDADAQSRLASAQAREAEAWGWYRNPDSFAARLAEERAETKAQKRFADEFGALSSRRSDWRTATDLKAGEDLVRRVALAREELGAADDFARQTAEAARRSAETLESIESTLKGGAE